MMPFIVTNWKQCISIILISLILEFFIVKLYWNFYKQKFEKEIQVLSDENKNLKNKLDNQKNTNPPQEKSIIPLPDFESLINSRNVELTALYEIKIKAFKEERECGG
ncbi:MAG: hypothetical protein FWC26_03595 [Fibromonadales bacterium]|nr:hypothetical protein [Fibromonadales bacterium]